MSWSYQCLLYCSRPEVPDKDVLVAASGPYIHTFNASDGDHLSTWPVPEEKKTFNRADLTSKTDSNESSGPSFASGVSEPPQKRRKLSSATSDSSAEIVVENERGDVGSSNLRHVSKSPIIKLACDSFARHVVAVSGDDKALSVFDLSKGGGLSQLSKRLMPKRPCAVVVTPDDSSILCADKFGDVYSLPLLGQTYQPSSARNDTTDASVGETIKASQTPFAPTATPLTVHTKRNRDALRQQQKTPKTKIENKSLLFDHQLILGHVSLLTDLTCATAASACGPRQYILTADRDEHIRVSRGMPQAHIIEGYLLGHTEFVSRLCVLPGHPHLLLSGGGDNYLLLWSWRMGIIQQKIDLKGHVESFKGQHGSTSTTKAYPVTSRDTGVRSEQAEGKIAVSNIVVVNTQRRTEIIVTCEGIPALFVYSLGINATVKYERSIPVEGNVNSVVFIENRKIFLYSMDVNHMPSSTTDVQNSPGHRKRPTMGLLNLTSLGWDKDDECNKNLIKSMEGCLNSQRDPRQHGIGHEGSVRELLYSLESLRKRGSED